MQRGSVPSWLWPAILSYVVAQVLWRGSKCSHYPLWNCLRCTCVVHTYRVHTHTHTHTHTRARARETVTREGRHGVHKWNVADTGTTDGTHLGCPKHGRRKHGKCRSVPSHPLQLSRLLLFGPHIVAVLAVPWSLVGPTPEPDRQDRLRGISLLALPFPLVCTACYPCCAAVLAQMPEARPACVSDRGCVRLSCLSQLSQLSRPSQLLSSLSLPVITWAVTWAVTWVGCLRFVLASIGLRRLSCYHLSPAVRF
ncbi:hypothetical protein B0H67DRAFT_247874 [Lasiosphaeris hirsuta]|uniref:Uncharacterized protein n=1 Tax=Lasiosphaeris hirsuta TaxID=260670 RepID=A0AA40AH11_9PEZI|nr:hypothetical protein B0H67DRAFT_247874 [Lasiosphaeris hirsuta]